MAKPGRTATADRRRRSPADRRRLVTGLAQGDFQIWEDGLEQEITQFTDERVPVSLGVLLNADVTPTLISANHQEDSVSRSVNSATELVYQGVSVSTVSRGSSSLPVASPPTAKVFFTRPYAMTSIAVFDAL